MSTGSLFGLPPIGECKTPNDFPYFWIWHGGFEYPITDFP